MSRKDLSWVECSKVNLIVGVRLFMKSIKDWPGRGHLFLRNNQ